MPNRQIQRVRYVSRSATAPSALNLKDFHRRETLAQGQRSAAGAKALAGALATRPKQPASTERLAGLSRTREAGKRPPLYATAAVIPGSVGSLVLTSSASLAATSAIGISEVSKPLREASMGLTSRRASYVVLWTMGTSWSRARVPKAPCPQRPPPADASTVQG